MTLSAGSRTQRQRHERFRGVATIPGRKDVRELVVGDRAVEAVAAQEKTIRCLQRFDPALDDEVGLRSHGSRDHVGERVSLRLFRFEAALRDQLFGTTVIAGQPFQPSAAQPIDAAVAGPQAAGGVRPQDQHRDGAADRPAAVRLARQRLQPLVYSCNPLAD